MSLLIIITITLSCILFYLLIIQAKFFGYGLFLIDIDTSEIKLTEYIIVSPSCIQLSLLFIVLFIPLVSGELFLYFLYWIPLYT